jgi:hypothetical protein
LLLLFKPGSLWSIDEVPGQLKHVDLVVVNGQSELMNGSTHPVFHF